MRFLSESFILATCKWLYIGAITLLQYLPPKSKAIYVPVSCPVSLPSTYDGNVSGRDKVVTKSVNQMIEIVRG